MSTTVEEKPEIKSKTKKELAAMYGVHPNTLIVWLLKNPALIHLASDWRKLFTPAEVKLIIENLGEP